MKPAHRRSLLLLIPILSLSASLLAQTTDPPWAVVNGVPVRRSQVEQAAKSQLDTLNLKRLQFEAGARQERQQLLESVLEQLVNDQLINAEAARRKIGRDELVAAEVDRKVVEPDEKSLADFYEANKSRIGGTREQAWPQIRQYLKQQSRRTLYDAFIGSLKQAYKTELLLEPLRIAVESSNHPSRGPADAPVTLVEFSDFECPYCARIKPTLRQVEKNYAGRVRVVFRQYPLTEMHPNAQKAAEASLCAQEQGRFWVMHDALFEQPRALAVNDLKAKAAKAGLDAAAFNSCLESGRMADRVRRDVEEAASAGVGGTPALFINGRGLSGAQPYEAISKIIEEELARASKSAARK